MSKSLMIAGSGSPVVYARTGIGTENVFLVCANAPLLFDTTRANTQITYRTAGKFSKASVSVYFNEFSNDATFVLEVNGASSALTITIPAGTTGIFSDNTHEVTIAAGDKVNWKLISAGPDDSALEIDLVFGSVVFAADTDTVVRHAAAKFAQQVNGLTEYSAMSDDCSTLNPTEVYAKFKHGAAGLYRNLFVYVSQWTNTAAFTATVTLRVNGSDTALTKALTGTGIFELTGTDVSIAAGDDVCVKRVTTGTGSITLKIVSAEWVSTAKQFHMIYGKTSGFNYTHTGGGQYQPAGGGGAIANLAEGYFKVPMGIAASISAFSTYVILDTITSAPGSSPGSVFTVRKSGAATAVTFTVAELSAPGRFEDATHSVTFTSTDDLDLECVASGLNGSISLGHIGFLVTNTEVDFVARVMIV